MVKTTYLQMFGRPDAFLRNALPPPRQGLSVLHAQRPTVRYYRFLYQAVGGAYDWTSRRILSDEQLAALIHDPRDEVHVLHVDGVPAGFAELDRRQDDEVELVQFGLMQEFMGQGLGRYFLAWTIDLAWSYRPKRVWLHTCTNDHEAALPLYVKAGFEIYREETKNA